MAAASSKPSPPARVERIREGIRLDGRLDGEGVGEVWAGATAALREGSGPFVVDAAGVTYCDGSGAALLVTLEREATSHGRGFELRGLQPEFASILEMIEPGPAAAPEAPRPREGILEGLGRQTLELVDDLRGAIAYLGELVIGLGSLIRDPGQLRFRDVMLIAERAGVGAVPIVALIGFLLGLILSFQSIIPMRRFGAEIFVADLLGLSLLRELGPLMAAIMLTARSGSAFAAEIGTMKVNEEVDALTTMGLDPTRFLILPRVVAAVLVVPVLAMLMNIAGLVGGAVMFRSQGFPLVTYVNRISEMVSVSDFLGGLCKAIVFGLIVAAVGCQRGLGTGKGAGAVGISTTSSVVTGITLIAITDGIFAVLFYLMGI